MGQPCEADERCCVPWESVNELPGISIPQLGNSVC
jgi:hypothetical protein